MGQFKTHHFLAGVKPSWRLVKLFLFNEISMFSGSRRVCDDSYCNSVVDERTILKAAGFTTCYFVYKFVISSRCVQKQVLILNDGAGSLKAIENA